MNIALSAIFSVTVFIFGQFILEFVIKPLSEQRKLISEIVSELTFYANHMYCYENEKPEDRKHLQEELRTFASKLEPISSAIFWGMIS